MNIYPFDEYKLALRALMADRQNQFGSRFTFEKMAASCGIQKTYLSKVLNSAAHLNPDQLYSAGEYLKVSAGEMEFLQLLRESEIAAHPKRSVELKTQIKKSRIKNLKTEAMIEVAKEDSVATHLWEYYTDVDLQLVHMFLTVRSYAAEPSLICEKIGISQMRLQTILFKLQEWQLVSFKKNVYEAKDPKMHLPEDSPVFLAFGILNRIKAIEKIRQVKADQGDDYFFSAVFSAEEKYQHQLKRKILELLKETQGEVLNSKSEEIYQLNIDLFRWS